MNTALFKTKSFLVEGSDKCACVIAGYRGKISKYRKVIKILNSQGFSVIAYEHSPAALTGGDPEKVLDLVESISKDFARKSSAFQEAICVGASIGAGLCMAVQRKVPKVKYGVYAGAGVSPAKTIFTAPLFYFVRQKFQKAGYPEPELKRAWHEIDILPTRPIAQTPFVMALGKRDKVVNYHRALDTLQAWQAQGQHIKIISKPLLGHLGIIRWHKSHFAELLIEGERLYEAEGH